MLLALCKPAVSARSAVAAKMARFTCCLLLSKPAVSARSAVAAKTARFTCCLPCASLQFQHEVLLLLKRRDVHVACLVQACSFSTKCCYCYIGAMYMLLTLCKPAVSARSAVAAKMARCTCCLPCASLQFQHEVLLLLKWRYLHVAYLVQACSFSTKCCCC